MDSAVLALLPNRQPVEGSIAGMTRRRVRLPDRIILPRQRKSCNQCVVCSLSVFLRFQYAICRPMRKLDGAGVACGRLERWAQEMRGRRAGRARGWR